MSPLRKILVPVDFSERCFGAARYAVALAGHFKAELSLVHVLEPMLYDFGTPEYGGAVIGELVANRAAQGRRQLDEFLSTEVQEVAVKRVLLEGDPARRIVEHAHSEQVDLIAMPTHGYGPFRRFILGSVTAKVLHDADCPVLTGVHMDEAPSPPPIVFRAIVCAVDLGPQSRKTVCWAWNLASEFGAQLVLVHAVPCIESRPGEYFDHSLAAEIAGGARQELEQLVQNARAQAEIVVRGGDAPNLICGLAAEKGAELVIIGRGSAAGLFGRLRTNAYAIIRQSPCPVVSV